MNSSRNLPSANQSLLLTIDFQERLLTAMPGDVIPRVRQTAVRVARAARILQVPALVTEQYPSGLGPTAPAFLPPGCDSPVLSKTSFSCGRDASICEHVRSQDRNELILTGMETHVCVLQSALDFVDQGYRVWLLEDAVMARGKQNHRRGLRYMEHNGVQIITSEILFFGWMRDKNHPAFKAISALVKETT